MSKLTAYTVEVYKADKRIKKDERYGRNKAGLRFVEVVDFECATEEFVNVVKQQFINAGFVAHIFETYVTRKNLIGGAEYQERYDTPHYCSPSSESYWSM
jgi:uncharacterized protein (DUF2126 family)